MSKELHAVTGAFGYSGKYITRKLLDAGKEVITLTNSMNRANPFGDKVKAYPYNFDNPKILIETLKGVSVLYNTYWVRFDHRDFNHRQAIGNSLVLFKAAREAGVKRIVHISIANPSLDSKLPYYLGKALLEKAIVESGMSYAILRPTVLFGGEDILINNIAWMLRHLQVMGIFGDGKYRMCPIHVEDLAKLAVEQGSKAENVIINAIGPEAYEYNELIKMLGETIGKKPCTVHVPPVFGLMAGWALGILMKDTVITREEIIGLTSNLLYVDAPPAGSIKLSEWARQNRDVLGVKYASELARRRNRKEAYVEL